MVQVLLDHGAHADLQLESKDGLTALDYAQQWNRTDVVQLLLRLGASGGSSSMDTSVQTPAKMKKSEAENPNEEEGSSRKRRRTFSYEIEESLVALADMGAQLFGWAMESTPHSIQREPHECKIRVQTADGQRMFVPLILSPPSPSCDRPLSSLNISDVKSKIEDLHGIPAQLQQLYVMDFTAEGEGREEIEGGGEEERR